MQRFKPFLDRPINLVKAQDGTVLANLDLVATYLPEQLEEFDELEFRTAWQDQQEVVLTIATEMGRIKRVMFGLADRQNPDLVRSMNQEQLAAFLADKGEQLVTFFQHIGQTV
ncbi:hypothetical protein [Desulfurispora thermophila]|uniref:hypothetical protein n=1 Tax=Desulfurispora thermophila TaxID=265470 RepID=UPI000372DA67|nr:hypothetical protein [Desulfurispora thermophila]